MLRGNPSALLIGKNGSGKSTLRSAFKVFQSIGRGINRVGLLVTPEDFGWARRHIPMRFEMVVELGGQVFDYTLVLEFPEKFSELRVVEESLYVDGDAVFTRDHARIMVHRNIEGWEDGKFSLDWHLIALTVIQDPVASDILTKFRDWLGRMVLLVPIPKLMSGEAKAGTMGIDEDASNWADWLSGLLDSYPAAYSIVSRYLLRVMPDISDFRFERTGTGTKVLKVGFESEKNHFELFSDVLSDGEKCFFLCAVVLAANKFYGPLFTFWDEPDNHLSLNEVSRFVVQLRRAFKEQGQIVMSSHNPEAIRRFSSDSTWVVGRKGHLEPTRIRVLMDIEHSGELIESLIEGDFDSWL
ncbi:AAA family ATPase [Burkholderia sp. Ac-20379]|uniref:AAA family ATPase n=1 Tax=Burkholderia sp. Ac-20379 TaxID=2703900 RepID=UPI001F11E90D|nr:ATP-binding protein [Burkholderia sp. Ac-20379]